MVVDRGAAPEYPPRNLLTLGEAAALSRIKPNVYLDYPDPVDPTWLPASVWTEQALSGLAPPLTPGDKAVYNELWMTWRRAMGLE